MVSELLLLLKLSHIVLSEVRHMIIFYVWSDQSNVSSRKCQFST